MIKYFGFSLLLLLTSLKSAHSATDQQTFIIEGMHCGGCAFSVESALERIGIKKKQIIEIDYGRDTPAGSLGHLKLGFDQGAYKGPETDCRIINAIHKYSGYIAYLDPKNPHPCDPLPPQKKPAH